MATPPPTPPPVPPSNPPSPTQQAFRRAYGRAYDIAAAIARRAADLTGQLAGFVGRRAYDEAATLARRATVGIGGVASGLYGWGSESFYNADVNRAVQARLRGLARERAALHPPAPLPSKPKWWQPTLHKMATGRFTHRMEALAAEEAKLQAYEQARAAWIGRETAFRGRVAGWNVTNNARLAETQRALLRRIDQRIAGGGWLARRLPLLQPGWHKGHFTGSIHVGRGLQWGIGLLGGAVLAGLAYLNWDRMPLRPVQMGQVTNYSRLLPSGRFVTREDGSFMDENGAGADLTFAHYSRNVRSRRY